MNRKYTNRNKRLYFITGWGFCSDIYKDSCLSGFNITTIDDKFPLNSIDKEAIIVAWSFGGVLAIEMALMFPKRVRALIFIASQPKFIQDKNYVGVSLENYHAFLSAMEADSGGVGKYFSRLVNYPNRTKKYIAVLKKYLSVTQSERASVLLRLKTGFSKDMRSSYSKIRVPILHLIGSKDAVVLQRAEDLINLNTKVVTKTIIGAGHAGFVTHRLEYLQAIEEFLQNVQ